MVEIGKSFPDRIVGESNDLANFMSMTGVQGAAVCTLLVFYWIITTYGIWMNETIMTIMLLPNYSQEQKIKQIIYVIENETICWYVLKSWEMYLGKL